MAETATPIELQGIGSEDQEPVPVPEAIQEVEAIVDDDLITEVPAPAAAALAVKSESLPTTSKLNSLEEDPSSAYNGQTTSKYSWSQTITDLEVKIPVQANILKGKQIIVEINTNSLKVIEIKQLTGSNDKELETIVNGNLTYPIVVTDSYWTLSPGKFVSVFLQKKQERWWTALLEGEPEIDIKKIEPVREFTDLQDEEQMKIQEMMYNQEQKMKGLPTSEEQKMHKILQEAWNKDGSPFKGTDFDPSKVKF